MEAGPGTGGSFVSSTRLKQFLQIHKIAFNMFCLFLNFRLHLFLVVWKEELTYVNSPLLEQFL